VDTGAVFVDAFGRVSEGVHRLLGEAGPRELVFRPDPEANSIAWLIWHLTRVMDDHVADLAGAEQVWIVGGWSEHFDLPFEPASTGYGHTPEQVGQVRPEPTMLAGYHDAVQDACHEYLNRLDPEELDRVVDERWDPPVTAGVRLVSVVGDSMQHLGQAGYVLGLANRAGA
jgi:hypothetical protein